MHPAQQLRRAGGRYAYCFAAMFSLWDGDGMRDLLSWWGFGAVSLALLAGGVVLIVRERRAVAALLRRPASVPLMLFVAVCLVSFAWTRYPLATAAGCGIQLATTIVALALVIALPPRRLATVFFAMLHVHLVLALLFELVVPLLPDGRIAPFFTDYGQNAPGAYYWSQGLLFTGGRIQGIVGNANLTCFIALLGVVMAGTLLAARWVSRRSAIACFALDGLMLALTRSATVFIAAGTVTAVLVLLIVYRRTRRTGRILVGVVAAVLVVGAGLSSSRISEPLLQLLGKGDDLTGRLEIWRVVGGLIAQHPILGWGWVSWWAPWTDPFNRLVVRSGVEYLQAHNAYLDVELQLGVPGLLALAILVGSVAARSLRRAVAGGPAAVLPLLLTVALLTQALAESRLLIEGNWATLAALSLLLPAHPPRRPEQRPAALTPENGLNPRVSA